MTTDTPNTTDPTENTDNPDTSESGNTETDTPDGEQDNGNKEAAKYRRRLRETEAERDTLKARLDVLQRNEVQRLVADRFADPADIWRDGATLEHLIDDDGNIDPTRVNDLATTLLDAHKHWGKTRQSGTRAFQSGASVTTAPRQDSFTQAFKPRER